MERISKAIAKNSKLILLLAIILLVPAVYGFIKTDVNYDILSYLPEETSTMQAEKILKDEFGCGSVAMLIVEDMPDKDVAEIKDKVAKLDGVKKALCVIIKILVFSENGFFTARFARIPALSPKTAEPFAAAL